MSLPEQNRSRTGRQLDLVTQLQTIIQRTFEIQFGEGRVLLQRLGQSADTFFADVIP